MSKKSTQDTGTTTSTQTSTGATATTTTLPEPPQTNTERNHNLLGVLWKRKGTNSKGPYEFLSGPITINGEKTEILVKKANFRNNERSPEYRIYKNEDLRRRTNPEPTQPPVDQQQASDDSVPF